MKKYANRIVGSGTLNPADIKANPLNWRKHPKSQAAALDEVLGSVGWIQEVIINKTTGNLIDGHLRVETALKNKETEIPVKYVELTEDEERIALATFDPISAMAERDAGMLKDLLASVESEDIDMSKFFEPDILPKKEHTEEELEAVPEAPKIAKTKRGDMYRLGEHVLMCGDSTVEDDVKKLMRRGLADMVFTDPPYALFGNSTGVSEVGDDTMIRPFFRALFKNMAAALKEQGHAYVCCDWHTLDSIKGEAKGLSPKNLIVWQKADGGGLGSYYSNTYELIWFFTRDIQQGILGKRGVKTRTINGVPNIWKQSVVVADKRLHNAQKPVPIIMKAITNSSDPQQIVLDLFGGSGSTLIACEETGRKCRMMELAPEYCDVIVERWENLTGKKAELIKGEA